MKRTYLIAFMSPIEMVLSVDLSANLEGLEGVLPQDVVVTNLKGSKAGTFNRQATVCFVRDPSRLVGRGS